MSTGIDPTRVWIVIPAYNEELRIREVAEVALAECPNVIVVDDGSNDATVARLGELPVILLRHAQRQGKGCALRDGFAEAIRRGSIGVLTMDGDGQHSADDLPQLLEAAAAHPGAIVIGARLEHRDRQPAYRRWANRFGDWGIGWACAQRIADSQSGQRYYPAPVLAIANLATDDFVYEADLLIEASMRLGTRCVSVPIESRYRHAGSTAQFRRSHFRPLRDLGRIVWHVSARILRSGNAIVRYRAARRSAAIIHRPPDGRHALLRGDLAIAREHGPVADAAAGDRPA